MNTISHRSPSNTLANLWSLAGLPPDALAHAALTGADPVLPSSFPVGTAAQASLAAAALAACELGHTRGQPRQTVSLDMQHAALECTGWFSLDGVVPDIWDAFSGLYRCADGFVRIHANFAHHRDGALRLLGLTPGVGTRTDAERAMLDWRALDFEAAAAERGLVPRHAVVLTNGTRIRRRAQWPRCRSSRWKKLVTRRRVRCRRWRWMRCR